MMTRSVSQTVLFVALTLLMAMGGLGIIYGIGRQVTFDVQRFSREIELISDDETRSRRTGVRGRDEFAQLAATFNRIDSRRGYRRYAAFEFREDSGNL